MGLDFEYDIRSETFSDFEIAVEGRKRFAVGEPEFREFIGIRFFNSDTVESRVMVDIKDTVCRNPYVKLYGIRTDRIRLD